LDAVEFIRRVYDLRARRRLLFISFAWAVAGCQAGPGPPNLVLVSIDTVRADHLEAYGYERSTAPNLTALARDGVLFEDAISQASWTLPSMATLFTSLYPSQHGAVRGNHRLSGEVWTVAEALRERGYRTLGVASHLFVGKRRGFAQGFDVFDQSQVRGHDAVTSSALTEIAVKMLGEHRDEGTGQPFFLWVHYFDPHFSYMRHPEFGFADGYDGELGERIPYTALKRRNDAGRVSRADALYASAAYDEEIAHTDAQLGILLAELEKLRGETVVVVTADHGEAFLEHGRFFHQDLYDEVVRVPLVLGGAIPRELRGRRISGAVELASVPRTLMSLAGVSDSPFQGRDLMAVALEGASGGVAFSEAMRPFFLDFGRKASISRDGWKLIHSLDQGTYELYDRRTDPAEQVDRIADSSEAVHEIRTELMAKLEEHRHEAAVPETIEVGEEELERLRALGYER